MNDALVISLLLLVFSIFTIKVKNIKYSFLSPPVLVNVFILLYVIIGFDAYWMGDYYFLDVDFTGSFEKIFTVVSVFSAVFTLSFILFYYIDFSGSKIVNDVGYELKERYVLLYFVVLMFYALLNLYGIRLSGLHNFILLFFNSLLVVVGYAFVANMKFSKVLLLILAALVIYMGFRYRLIFLLLPIIFSVFILRKMTFVRFLIYIVGVVSAVSVVAIVGVARKYSSGLQVEKLEGYNFFDVIIKGIFNDTSTVFVSGAFIEWLDSSRKFAYFDQITYMFNYFIPSQLYAGKLYSPIFLHLSNVTNQPNNESGAAVLGFAEYYHTAGYVGVVIFALIFSFVFSRLFRRIMKVTSLYYHYAYFVLAAWLINSFTRGYFPQNAQDLISILLGLYVIKLLSKKVYL
jgi:oligosaccharide repeat unit polymerase